MFSTRVTSPTGRSGGYRFASDADVTMRSPTSTLVRVDVVVDQLVRATRLSVRDPVAAFEGGCAGSARRPRTSGRSALGSPRSATDLDHFADEVPRDRQPACRPRCRARFRGRSSTWIEVAGIAADDARGHVRHVEQLLSARNFRSVWFSSIACCRGALLALERRDLVPQVAVVALEVTRVGDPVPPVADRARDVVDRALDRADDRVGGPAERPQRPRRGRCGCRG